MSYNSSFEAVENELLRMAQAAEEARLTAWLLIPVAFLAHGAILAVVVWIVGLLLGNSPAVIGWAIDRVHKKVIRMAVHATSVHDEVLLVKELIKDEQRQSVQRR